MNREKILFLVVAGIAVLWGGLRLTSPFEDLPGAVPGALEPNPPAVKSFASLPESERLLTVIAETGRLPTASPESGARPLFVRHSDLLPVEPADLDLPRALPTPWICVPVDPFPPVTYYRQLREDAVPPVAARPEEAPADEGGAVEPPPQNLPTVQNVLGGGKKFEFHEEEWDELTVGPGIKWYGRVSLTKESKATGKTKYDLLLPENRELEFFFEQLDKETGRVISSAATTMEKSGIESLRFADTVENQFWTRRTVNRIRKTDETALCDLADWTLELAGNEKYDRPAALALAADTYREALADKPGFLRAILGLGESLHRQFRFDEELGLYEDALKGSEVAELLARKARIYRKLGLDDLVVKTLGRAIFLVPGDESLRMRRAEAHLRLGDLDRAVADFAEAEKLATAEGKAAAREGRARALIAMAKPAAAESLLSGAGDAASLVTLGAARYAQRKWPEALEAFQQAAQLDPDDARALTCLGIARARAAAEWADVELAIEMLGKAREMDPLNYFLPYLGLGFAEQRLGDPDESARQEYLTESIESYQTATEALPGDPYAHYVLGRSFLRDGNYEAARKEFETASFLDYRFADALLGAGTASLSLGDWKKARQELQRFATVEERARQASKGAGEVRTATEGAILAHYRLGRAWLMSEDVSLEIGLEKAKGEFEKVLALAPQHVPSLNALGYILYNLGNIEASLTQFDRAGRLAAEGGADALYRKQSVAKIEDSRSRRRWRDSFDRPTSSTVGNAWLQVPQAGVPPSPRLENGKVVVAGRWSRATPTVWLYHGDPTATTLKTNVLNLKFIRTRAVLNVGKLDRVTTRFLVFYQPGQGGIRVAAGFERNARGQVVLLHRKTSDKDWTRAPAKDESGQILSWPEGDVTLEIARIDPKRGRFELRMDGVSLGVLDLGLKQSNSPLSVGFSWQGTAGDSFRTEIGEVEIEIYAQ